MGADRARIERNRLTDTVHGIDVHGWLDTLVRNNMIEGRHNPHMTERGNGIHVWNSPETVVEGNSVRWSRDGILSNASKTGTCRKTCNANCALRSIACTGMIPLSRATSRSATTVLCDHVFGPGGADRQPLVGRPRTRGDAELRQQRGRGGKPGLQRHEEIPFHFQCPQEPDPVAISAKILGFFCQTNLLEHDGPKEGDWLVRLASGGTVP